MRGISEIVTWLEDTRWDVSLPRNRFEELCRRLEGAGIPIERAAIFLTLLDPVVAGRTAVWHRDQHIEVGEIPSDLHSDARTASPGDRVRQIGLPLRRRLLDAATVGEFPLLAELRAEGLTDYLATPLRFTNGEIHAASWATRQRGGFTDEDLELLNAVARPLAGLTEILTLRDAEATLLATYVGRQSGARVLAGQIHRGDTELIHAAIWLSDLRGFTSLTEQRPPQEVIGLLNRYFDCQVPAIEARNGEVLKFMGDGLLAIFPTADGGPARTCAAALAAARDARAKILAQQREGALGGIAGPPFSLALHIGELLYGNIGGGGRLDFTVIGPAINLAARLERLARDLGRCIITSGTFAELCGEPLTPLGTYPLRGIAAVQPAFGLPEEDAPGDERRMSLAQRVRHADGRDDACGESSDQHTSMRE